MMAENFPGFMKDININIQEAQWTPSKMDLETYTETYYSKTFSKVKDIEKILKTSDLSHTKDPQ